MSNFFTRLRYSLCNHKNILKKKTILEDGTCFLTYKCSKCGKITIEKGKTNE